MLNGSTATPSSSQGQNKRSPQFNEAIHKTMPNLRPSFCLIETLDKVRYTILSHGPLSHDDAARALAKRSLRRVAGSGQIPGYVGTFKFVEVIAADGWQDAD